MTRAELEAQYERIRAQMEKLGLDPVVGMELLEVLDDSELVALIKDSLFRLMRFRRLEGEL